MRKADTPNIIDKSEELDAIKRTYGPPILPVMKLPRKLQSCGVQHAMRAVS